MSFILKMELPPVCYTFHTRTVGEETTGYVSNLQLNIALLAFTTNTYVCS